MGHRINKWLFQNNKTGHRINKWWPHFNKMGTPENTKWGAPTICFYEHGGDLDRTRGRLSSKWETVGKSTRETFAGRFRSYNRLGSARECTLFIQKNTRKSIRKSIRKITREALMGRFRLYNRLGSASRECTLLVQILERQVLETSTSEKYQRKVPKRRSWADCDHITDWDLLHGSVHFCPYLTFGFYWKQNICLTKSTKENVYI